MRVSHEMKATQQKKGIQLYEGVVLYLDAKDKVTLPWLNHVQAMGFHCS